jgi:hypothetical protein
MTHTPTARPKSTWVATPTATAIAHHARPGLGMVIRRPTVAVHRLYPIGRPARRAAAATQLRPPSSPRSPTLYRQPSDPALGLPNLRHRHWVSVRAVSHSTTPTDARNPKTLVRTPPIAIGATLMAAATTNGKRFLRPPANGPTASGPTATVPAIAMYRDHSSGFGNVENGDLG